MPKGFFTQSCDVLLSAPTTLDAVVPLLSDFRIAKRIDETTEAAFGGPGLVIPFRTEVNGNFSVDVRNRIWPDQMGDAKTEGMLFGAWLMGHYGPFVFPGSFRRAQNQMWAWHEGEPLVEKHAAFLHITASYIFGASADSKVLPPDYDPMAEMEFMTKLAVALLSHPNAVAYFNPNGEVILSKQKIVDSIAYHRQHEVPPLGIWSNIRVLNPNNGWLIVDTVGMEQFDRPDLEACFPKDAYNINEVSVFLRNACLYLLTKGDVIKSADTMDGPGRVRWQGFKIEKELSPPPRRVIRWFPLDGTRAPAEMFALEPEKP
jgi:hypothetical protein